MPTHRRITSLAVACLSVITAGQACAATGSIGLTVNSVGPGTISKSSNISGPTFVRGKGSFTATFASATNTSGYISADMTYDNYESFCDNTFTTVVTNGVCRVVLGTSRSGQGVATCTSTLGNVNPQTCDFTATFTDTPGAGSGPPH